MPASHAPTTSRATSLLRALAVLGALATTRHMQWSPDMRPVPAMPWLAIPLMALFASVAIAIKVTLIRNLDESLPLPHDDHEAIPS